MMATAIKRAKSPSQPTGQWIRAEKRLAIYLRDRFTCLYCLRDMHDADPRDITLDHVVCQSSGKHDHSEGNLVTACRSCNCSRQDKPLSRWDLYDEGDDEVADGRVLVEIEPDHDALISAAGGDPDCDHEWTSEGEGGCDENPGVWSHGGTAMSFASHCRICGLHKSEYHHGMQGNPDAHDTVTYRQPESWCAECEREECEC